MSNFWKGADPQFDRNNQGNYDLKFEQGEENWLHDDFRVGDEITYLPTGEKGHIEETLDVDRFSVMLDSGEYVEATKEDLQPEGSGKDEFWGEPEVERFEGDDPEAQNFEDPSFSNQPYNFSTELNAANPELIPGDWIHVFNPYPVNEDFIDQQGTVTEGSGDSYRVDINGNTVDLAREEIDLIGRKENTDPRLSWWKGAAPIKIKPEDKQPGDEGFSVPWGAGENAEGNIVPTTPDRDKDNPNKLKKDNTPTVTKSDLERHGLTQEKMTENIKRAFYAAPPEMVQDGAEWYDIAQASAQRIVDELGEQTGITLEQVVGIQSAISPMLSWEQNERYPPLIITQYMIDGMSDPTEWRDSKIDQKTGLNLKLSVMIGNRNKCISIMNGEPLETIFKGPKTKTFLSNIAGTDRDNATVDVWATRVAFGETLPRSLFYSPKEDKYLSYYAPANSIYQVFNEAYRQATYEINEETGQNFDVSQVQAVTWIAYKNFSPAKSSDLPAMTIDEIEQHYAGQQQTVNAWWKGAINEDEFSQMWGGETPQFQTEQSFEIGDTVSIYSNGQNYYGTVLSENDDGTLRVRFHDHGTVPNIDPSQLSYEGSDYDTLYQQEIQDEEDPNELSDTFWKGSAWWEDEDEVYEGSDNPL